MKRARTRRARFGAIFAVRQLSSSTVSPSTKKRPIPASGPSSGVSPSASQGVPSCWLIGPVKGWYSARRDAVAQRHGRGAHLLGHGLADLADQDPVLGEALPRRPSVPRCRPSRPARARCNRVPSCPRWPRCAAPARTGSCRWPGRRRRRRPPARRRWGAVESVCWKITSAPSSMSACAASASIAGSNQVLAQITRNSTSGLTWVACR